MIKEIAKKEFTEYLRDGRFRWTALIILALLLVALGLGWKNYSDTKRERAAAQTDSRNTWENQGERNPHSAAHFGVYAFRPKTPLSLIDSGLDNFSGSTIWVEAHYQNPSRNRPIEDATALQRFGELTAAGVLQLLLPLLIIFLVFDAFAGERTNGTLRQVLSVGVKRSSFVFGKILGTTSVLFLLLIPATIIGVLALALATSNENLLSSLPRFLLMCVGYLLYFGAFIGFALTVSALASTTRLALIILLGFWVFTCLLMPRLANDTSERFYPNPTAEEFWAKYDKLRKEGVNGHDPSNKKRKELEQEYLKKYKVEKKEDLPINFSGIAFNASEEFAAKVFDNIYGEIWQGYYRQESLQKTAGVLSPLMPIRFFSMGMAGTDLSHTEDFTNEVEQYRREFNRFLNMNIAESSSTADGNKYFGDKKVWQKTPDFVYQPRDTSWALSRQIWNFALLFVWCFATLGLSIFAANRMKVM